MQGCSGLGVRALDLGGSPGRALRHIDARREGDGAAGELGDALLAQRGVAAVGRGHDRVGGHRHRVEVRRLVRLG